MKTLTINGVPYLINEAGDAFVYSSVPPIPIGKYDSTTKVLSLVDNWEEKMDSWVQYYRDNLKTQTEAELEKAAQLQKSA
jgi:hypothetical protein